jgi:tetratricopeptide (TPR) repeat protein
MMALIRVCVPIVLLTVFVGIAAAGPTDAGKIPITTSSAEARDLFVKARLLSEQFKFADARGLYQQAVIMDPNFALAFRGLAQAQPDAKSYQEDMDKAVAAADKVSDCERLLILSDNAAGKLNLAEQRQDLAQLLATCGGDEHGHMQLGLYYYGRQFFDSAAAELSTATTLAPGFVAAWNMLGYSHRSLGDYAGAERDFRKYIELSPEDANAYDSYAELLLKEGKYEDAITQYRKALSVDSTFVLSHFNMAAPLMYLGRHADARKECQMLMSKAVDDGQRATAYFGIAVTYADEGNLDDAVKTIEQSNALSEKINDAATEAGNYALIGLLRLEQGKYDEALTQYEKSIRIAGKSDLSPAIKAANARNLFYFKARRAAKSGDATAATAWADSFAVRCRAAGSSNDLRAMHQLNGIVALEAKQYAKAVEELKQGPAQNGYDMYRLALAYEGSGDHVNAVKQMTAAANINSVPNFNDVLARQKAKKLADEWAPK